MKQQSGQAQVAKLAKKYILSKGIKCSAKSDSFSMGNSVSIEYCDVPPNLHNEIKKNLDQYQYGHFDGMTDMYEYSNRRDDIPQTKYLSITNVFSDELRQKAWNFMRKQYPANAENLPENYDKAKDKQFYDNVPAYMTVADDVYQILNGSNKRDSDLFWAEFEQKTTQKIEINNKQNSVSAHIEEHEHTKKNIIMYLVVLDSNVERDEFNTLRVQAKKMGGWYSRKWGKTPGGFAFELNELAEQFLLLISSNDQLATREKNQTGNKNRAEKFRSLADKMQSQINDKLRGRETNTPKKLAQANHARLEGERLQRTQKVLYALADLHDDNKITQELASLASKSSIYELLGTITTEVPNGYHSYRACTGEPSNKTSLSAALWSIIGKKTEEQKKADELSRKIDGLKFSKIPGFFPTPENIIDLMIEKAEIRESDRILEPNLGSCAIADKIAGLCREVKGFEVNYTLAEIADEKDYLIQRKDFLTVGTREITSYEKILMNPPFENKQAIYHTMHAYKFLKPGGILVSILDSGAFNNSDKKSTEFRSWLSEITCEYEELPKNSFKESGTGVNTYILTIYNN